MDARSLDQLCINTMRFLAVDAVEKAKSGHPGTPLGAAVMAYVLWDRFLKHNPADPKWPDRDRFVLSAGHACAMLYALLHLTGYDLSLDEIKQFRQWGSRTPGHSEYGVTPGVEATTGPLGQGFGNAVGMAVAERWYAQHYNRPGHEIINHRIYAIVSDGDLEEGVSSEAASFAGTLGLGKIIFLYDANRISIEGDTRITFTEDVAMRFRAYGWNVIGPIDGLDIDAVSEALTAAEAQIERPNLIVCQTIIGYGSPNKAGKAEAHGEPLGEEEVRLSKRALGWPYEDLFYVPPEALAHFRRALERGRDWQRDWQDRLSAYRRAYPREADQLEQDLSGELPPGWDNELAGLFAAQTKPISTRAASGRAMNALARRVHALTGGSGDLAPSTRTLLTEHFAGLENDPDHNMHFGVREHSMGTIVNGMALGGLIPFGATFLIFYDYMRPPVRLAALMGIRAVFVFTHDSVGLGQDGPTHQPIEQLMGMRAVPNLVTIRPADANETAEAWRVAVERRTGPTALVFTRQDVPVLDQSAVAPASGLRRGGYVLWEGGSPPAVIIIGTGSEVHIALQAAKALLEKGVKARVVSLPSWALFDAQPAEYRDAVLPPEIRARVSIEAASPVGWEHYVGLEGKAIGVARFGASAPGDVVYQKLGLTADRVVAEALGLLRAGGA